MTGEPPIESVLDSVVDATPGAAYRRRRGDDQPLLAASDGIEALTGYDDAALADAERGWLDVVDLDDRERLCETIADAEPGDSVEATYRIRRPDGDVVRVRDRMTVDRDDPTVLEGVVLDATERFGDRWSPEADDRTPDAEADGRTSDADRAASRRTAPPSVVQARRDAALLDAIFEHIPVHLYVKDDDAVHRRVSRHLGRSEAYVGKTDLEIDEMADEHAEQAYEDDVRVIETEEPVLDKEEFLPVLDLWNLTSKVALRDDDGDVCGLVGVSREITERKRTQQELRRKTERLAEFADVLSHDIRDPLNVARSRVESARTAEDPASQIDDAAAAIDRANGIIDDVLALSRNGRGEVEAEPASLTELASAAWRDVADADATLELPDERIVARADRSQLRRLLENLFSNAIEQGDGATVAVETVDSGFAVADDGPGIPAEKRERVFDPSYSTREGGTGFGLAIVEEIADAHGWSVSIGESDAGGARFEVTGVEREAVRDGDP